ncbi:MAG: Flp pilus assembly complex ATPase component TadA [Planctomycetes bacterium]|nr:Flp pilus assembly complex ATPase component TadA [Planctomycetota bacterium]
MARRKKKLGEILVGWGLLNANALADALKYASEHDKRIGEALVELELCGEDDVCKALATQFGLEYVDLDKNVIDHAVLELIPDDLIRRHMVLPMGLEGETLKIIITDPLDLETLDVVRFRLARELKPALAPVGKVKRFIDTFINPMDDELSKTMSSIDQDRPDEEQDDLHLDADDADAPIIRLINLVISEAVHSRASDIHIEPMSDRVRVRYRVDGVCHIRDDIPLNMRAAVTTRLKIMSGMDIAERRLPQDGRIKMRFGHDKIDFRVSSLPSYHGESIVLRILRPESVQVGIEALGFEEHNYKTFLKVIRRPNGIFLVTGPTGSGKTTTLYAALQELNRPDRKIITAEDPVEYNFTGINQCQVKEEIGLTFPRILRSMLRQAPNIILVGEIRDKEVADVAIQAALTGHLVFSTLHTNDAPSAITRLIDMGVKPFLVASSIQAIMAQRLIRLLCKECKVEDPAPRKQTLRLLGFTDEELSGRTLYKPVGCKRCAGTGYRGRQGIFEMMILNTEVRELAFNRAPTNHIRSAARAAGMSTLTEDGRIKILRGVTTPDEVVRITQADDIDEQSAA